MKKRVLALLLSAALLCALAACGDPDASGSSSAAAAIRLPPGTYTGTGQGFGGPIEVEVTLSEHRIEKVLVTSNSETAGIGSNAITALPGAILEAQSVQVDAITGATLASQGILEAVTAALESAGVDVSALTPVNDDSAAPAEQILDADVVVVGAGGAGMTAAIAAAQAGKQVVVLEKTGIVGGSTARATDGLNAARTPWQNDNGFVESDALNATLATAAEHPQLADLVDIVRRQYTSWSSAGSSGYFDSAALMALDTALRGEGLNDLDLVTTLAAGSSSAIDWLDSLGAQLHAVAPFSGACVKRLHRPVNDKGQVVAVGSYLVPILEQSCVDNGVRIICNAPVTDLLMEGGRAVGVKADGYTVNAGAVILATGGFSADPDMVAQYAPALRGLLSASAPGCTGDGIRLALASGAAVRDMDLIQVSPTVEPGDAALIAEGLRDDGAILVNAEGLRFCNEVDACDAVSAAVLDQTEGCAWLIADQRMADASTALQGYIDSGCAVKANTYAALAKAMDVPVDAFTDTMTDWNQCVSAWYDPAFGRRSFAYPLDTGPYYAIRITPGLQHTLGGVVIDADARVLSPDGSAIPGLFAAGEVTGGVHGAALLGGNALTELVVFGRIAGATAAASVP